MNLQDYFDAVIMLTWSDWKSEPRSNRYHYATRFARTLPVLFLQHQYSKRSQISVEPSGIENIDIVNVSMGLNDGEIASFKQLMNARGIRRPLVWIYDSLSYQALLDAMPTAFRVYHATEDYLTKSDGWNDGWNSGRELVAKSVVRMLDQVDLMVACTEGVATACLTLGNYRGEYVVVENGCDAEYFLEYAQQYDQSSAALKPPSAVFQGGINNRLDYSLLCDLIQRMPTWEFRFCGKAIESEGWSCVLQLPNVKYYGELLPEGFARVMCDSTVGIITYIQDDWIRNSLPLKAYEYVACGLPVVTVPIAALERDPDLMTIATTPEEFEISLRTVAKSRFDPVLLEKRRESALAKSYNRRFSSMCERLLAAKRTSMARTAPRNKFKLAMLYDKDSMRVGTIQQHLNAFQQYSNHQITYVPATSFWNLPPEKTRSLVDFSYFDVVVVHYSVRLSVKEHLDEGLACALENFQGFKVLFIQDEYDGTEIARQWMDRLRFDLVYTCVPDAGREHVYPSYRFPLTEFLPMLTGCVLDELGIEQTGRAYADIIGPGKFSYKSFIEAFDKDIETRVLHGKRFTQLPAPLFFVASDGSLRQALPAMPTGLPKEACDFPQTLADFHGVSYIAAVGSGLVLNSNLAQTNLAPTSASNSSQVESCDMHSLLYRNLRWVWYLLPLSMRVRVFGMMREMMRLGQSVSPKSRVFRLARQGWRLLPLGVRVRFIRILERAGQGS